MQPALRRRSPNEKKQLLGFNVQTFDGSMELGLKQLPVDLPRENLCWITKESLLELSES